jgi:hypothetical protein
MSQSNSGSKAFIANANLEAYRRVKLSAGSGSKIEYAMAGEACIGITALKANQNEMVSVDLLSSGRTFKVTAAGAITEGADFYGADNGRVSATVSGTPIGKALEAATSNLEIIEGLFV